MTRGPAIIDLRDGLAADLGLVSTLMQQSFDPAYGEAWTASQCLGIMSLPGVWLTLASIDGVPTGFALARAAAGESELLLLATIPAARKRGVARALLTSVIAQAAAMDASEIHLEVRERNHAIYLYEREGFEQVGRRRDYYQGKTGRRYDALSYRKTL